MEDNIIEIEPVEETPYLKDEQATEAACGTLVSTARELGRKLKDYNGLMYLSDQAVTRQFIAACRAVLALLKTNEEI